METTESAFNIATFVLLGIGVLVVFSLLTLFVYFFGGPNPLERNIYGRIEAGLKPEDVARDYRQWRSQRHLMYVLVAGGVWFVLDRFAPEQTGQAAESLLEAVSIVLSSFRDAVVALVQQVGGRS